MNVNDLRITRDELSAQARAIRTGSADLSGSALTEAQQTHRRIMQRITQLNDAIRNSN